MEKINILVAEDAEFNQLLIEHALIDLGISVDIAENGQIAVEFAKINSYDLIFMDLEMPIMDGFAAAAEIKTFKPKQIIIALTSYDIEKIVHESPNFEGFIMKSADLEELKTILSNTIDKYHQELTLNLSYLESFTGNDASFKKQMIDIFIESTPKILSTIKNHIHQDEFEKAREAAHKFNSQLQFMGNEKALNQLNLLEIMCKEKRDANSILLVFEDIKRFCLKAIQQLK